MDQEVKYAPAVAALTFEQQLHQKASDYMEFLVAAEDKRKIMVSAEKEYNSLKEVIEKKAKVIRDMLSGVTYDKYVLVGYNLLIINPNKIEMKELITG